MLEKQSSARRDAGPDHDAGPILAPRRRTSGARRPRQRGHLPLLIALPVALVGALWFSPPAMAQVSFYTTVDLALRTSPSVHMATADVRRAEASVMEARDAYKPSLAIGGGPGYSYGFPLGEPSIVNLTSQSLVLSFFQPDYIRSARAAVRAAQLALKDARQQVVLDTALDYIELDKTTRQLSALDAQNSAAEKLATIEQERVDAGIDGRTELLRAKLTGAQMRLKRLHVEDDAAVLREKLADLTGLPAASFVTSAESIPAPPTFLTTDPGLRGNLAGAGNAGVESAYAAAQAKDYVAHGDRRQVWRPQVGFGATYSRFSNYNNYSEYYKNFQTNNVAIGIQITIPLFNASLRDKALGSAADAAHAIAQADQLRDQTSEQMFQLQTSFAELTAQEEVARLQSELAENELQTVLTQLESGNGSAGSPQLTPKDEQQARIEERQRYQEFLDANFELTRAQLNLLRMAGAIEEWAMKAPHP